MGTRTVNDDTITLGNKVVEKTAIIQLETTVDELINATGETIKSAKEQFFFLHSELGDMLLVLYTIALLQIL